jgi:glycosyltransferase involved in cell wall biosynthesis
LWYLYDSMKIAFLVGSTQVGGAELQALAQALLAQSLNYSVCIHIISSINVDQSELTNLYSCHSIHWVINKYDNDSRYKTYKSLKKIAIDLRSDYDIILGLTQYPNLVASLASAPSVKTVWQQRDAWLFPFLSFFDEIHMFKTNVVITNSINTSKILRNKLLKFKNVSVIGNIPDPRIKEIHNLEKEPNFTNLTAINVSNFKDSKNIFTLLDIWNDFVYRSSFSNTTLNLKLIGNYPENLADYKNYIDSLPSASTIEIISNCFNPFPYYEKADCYLTTTLSEGRSNAIDHAMYYQLPIVGTALESIYEQVHEDNYILMEDLSSIHNLPFKLEFLSKNPELALKIGKKNRSKILSYYTTSVEDWKKLFLDLSN